MLEIGACLEIGSCLRSEAIYGDLTGYRDGWRWVQRESNQKMGRERERARVCKVVVERNNKKIEKNEYFIEISCKIDKLM